MGTAASLPTSSAALTHGGLPSPHMLLQLPSVVDNARLSFESGTDIRSSVRPALVSNAQLLSLASAAGAGAALGQTQLLQGQLDEVALLTAHEAVSHSTKMTEAVIHAAALHHGACQRERAQAAAPLLRGPVRPPSAGEDAQLKQVVLASLSAVADSLGRSSSSTVASTAAAPAAAGAPAAATRAEQLRALVSELGGLLSDFKPQSLYEDWAPAELGPERPLLAPAVDPRRTFATGAAFKVGAPTHAPAAPLAVGFALAEADAAAPWDLASRGLSLPAPWRGERNVSSVVWGVTFGSTCALPISSIKLWLGVSD